MKWTLHELREIYDKVVINAYTDEIIFVCTDKSGNKFYYDHWEATLFIVNKRRR